MRTGTSKRKRDAEQSLLEREISRIAEQIVPLGGFHVRVTRATSYVSERTFARGVPTSEEEAA